MLQAAASADASRAALPAAAAAAAGAPGAHSAGPGVARQGGPLPTAANPAGVPAQGMDGSPAVLMPAVQHILSEEQGELMRVLGEVRRPARFRDSTVSVGWC